jgi:hypothetical protein
MLHSYSNKTRNNTNGCQGDQRSTSVGFTTRQSHRETKKGKWLFPRQGDGTVRQGQPSPPIPIVRPAVGLAWPGLVLPHHQIHELGKPTQRRACIVRERTPTYIHTHDRTYFRRSFLSPGVCDPRGKGRWGMYAYMCVSSFGPVRASRPRPRWLRPAFGEGWGDGVRRRCEHPTGVWIDWTGTGRVRTVERTYLVAYKRTLQTDTYIYKYTHTHTHISRSRHYPSHLPINRFNLKERTRTVTVHPPSLSSLSNHSKSLLLLL